MIFKMFEHIKINKNKENNELIKIAKIIEKTYFLHFSNFVFKIYTNIGVKIRLQHLLKV